MLHWVPTDHASSELGGSLQRELEEAAPARISLQASKSEEDTLEHLGRIKVERKTTAD